MKTKRWKVEFILEDNGDLDEDEIDKLNFLDKEEIQSMAEPWNLEAGVDLVEGSLKVEEIKE